MSVVLPFRSSRVASLGLFKQAHVNDLEPMDLYEGVWKTIGKPWEKHRKMVVFHGIYGVCTLWCFYFWINFMTTSRIDRNP